MAEFGIWAWVGLYYEIGILIVYSTFLFLVIQRYYEKKNPLTKLLVWVFIFYALAIVFSIVSKVFNAVWGGVPYLIVDAEDLWIIARLHSGRFGFACAIIATMITFHFSKKVFEKDIQMKKVLPVQIFGAIIVIFQVVVYEFNTDTGKSNGTYDILAFVLMFVFMLIVYTPFMYQTLRLKGRIEGDNYKKAFKSLGVMAFAFMMIFCSFLLDRIMLLTIGWAYSVFYFMAWAFAIVGIISAYLGYIKPKSAE